MSDESLRELERAGDWTRLALARRRAGLDGASAAVQALLRDPAAPVRELLAAGAAPAPRSLTTALPPLELAGDLELGRTDLLDLGLGRALLAGPAELVGLDLLGDAATWRRARRPEETRPAIVGPRVAWLDVDGPVRVRWVDAATGAEAEPLLLPGLHVDDPRHLLPRPLVALDGARCAALVPHPDGAALVLCDLERRRATRVVPLPADEDEDGPEALFGGDGVACVVADGRLRLVDEGRGERWSVEVPRGGEAVPLAVDGGRLVVLVSGPAVLRGVLQESLHAYDLRDGAERLALDCPGSWGTCAAGGLVVVARRAGSCLRLAATSVGDGRAAWSVELPAEELELPRASVVDLRAAGDVLLVGDQRLHGTPWSRGRPAATTALDLATGATVWTRAALEGEWFVGAAAGLLVSLGAAGGATRLRRFAP